MNNYLPFSAVTEQFTYPSTPDASTAAATVTFETGESVASSISLVSGSTYQVTIADDYIDSAGTYSIKWTCLIGGQSFYRTTNFSVMDVYLDSADFFSAYPDFSVGEFAANFDGAEKLARRIIDTYTGQNFQYIQNKTFSYYGNGSDKLYTGKRISHINTVMIDGSDYTTACDVDFESRYFIRLKTGTDQLITKFPKSSEVTVTGDWGWPNVPWEITQATELLVIDLLDDVKRETYRYGISRLWQDTNRVEVDKSIYNTTGNIDVDTLLMDYVYWTMDYVY